MSEENKFLNVLSKILFGFLSFILAVFGYILWLALKKHYPEQAKVCLIASSIGTVMIILAVVMSIFLPSMEDIKDKDNITKTEQKVEIKETQEVKKQTNSDGLTKMKEKVINDDFPLIETIVAVIFIGIIVLIIRRFLPLKCPNCKKRGGLEEIETISLGEATSGHKIETLRTNYYNSNNRKTRYSTREVRVRVTREPMLTTYICRYCGEECQKEWIDEQEV